MHLCLYKHTYLHLILLHVHQELEVAHTGLLRVQTTYIYLVHDQEAANQERATKKKTEKKIVWAQVRREDTVTLEYRDSRPAMTSGMSWSPDFIKFRGVIRTEEVINADSVLRVLVGDPDLTVLANLPQAYVVLTSASGSSVRLTLTENSTTPGWFYGSVNTYTRAANAPGTLGGATPGSIITVSYLDCSDNFDVIARVRVAQTPSVAFSQAAMQTSAGLPLSVTVTDFNKGTMVAIDTATVGISAGSDMETITVLETGPSTGVYTGIMQVRNSSSTYSVFSAWNDPCFPLLHCFSTRLCFLIRRS
jgi:hypothetical protein